MSWSVREHRTTPLPASLACRLDTRVSSHTQEVDDTHLHQSKWPMNTITNHVEGPSSNSYTSQMCSAPPSQLEQSGRDNAKPTQMARAALYPTTATAMSCGDANTPCDPFWHRPPPTPPPSYQSHIPPSLRQSQVVYPSRSAAEATSAPSSSAPAPTGAGAEPRRVLSTHFQQQGCNDICAALQGVRDSMRQQTSVMQAQSEIQQSLLHAALQAQENFDRVFVEFKEELRATREAVVLFLANRNQTKARRSPSRNATENNTKTSPQDKNCPENVPNPKLIRSVRHNTRNTSSLHTNVVTLLGATLSNQSNSSTNTPSDAALLRSDTCTSHCAGSLGFCNALPVGTGTISSSKRRMASTENDDQDADNKLGCSKKQQRRSIESEAPAAMHLSDAAAAGDEGTADPEENVFFI